MSRQVRSSGKSGQVARSAPRHNMNELKCQLGEVVDLSTSGMRVACPSRPAVKVNQLVTISLRCPGQTLRVSGKVVWIRRKGLRSHQMGVQFLCLSPQLQADLDSLAKFGYVDRSLAGDEEPAGANPPTVSASIDVSGYYRTLGLEPGADLGAVHQAYRNLARRYHPDVNPSPEGVEQFLRIKEAYELISKLERRSA